MNNFVQRLITILIGASLGIFLITYNSFTINLFFFTVIIFIYGELLNCLDNGNKLNPEQIFVIFILLVSFYCQRYEGVILLVLCENPIITLMYFGVGLLWTYPTIYLSWKYIHTDPKLFIIFSTIVWFSDGGAYIFGNLFGKNKLAPSISPNKTIEGAVGGILLSSIVAFLFSFYYTKIRCFDFIILGLIYGVFGTLGDLIESKFKRWCNVKDSGFLFNNAGGILDKTDSLFFALPVGHYFLYCRKYF